MASDSHIPNIGERGARRRYRAGILLVVLSAAALIVLLVLDAPSWSGLLVGIPAGLAAAEILQAREKT